MVNIIIQVIRQMRPQLYHYIRRVVYLVPHIGSTEVGERDINSLPEYVAMLIFFLLVKNSQLPCNFYYFHIKLSCWYFLHYAVQCSSHYRSFVHCKWIYKLINAYITNWQATPVAILLPNTTYVVRGKTAQDSHISSTPELMKPDTPSWHRVPAIQASLLTTNNPEPE